MMKPHSRFVLLLLATVALTGCNDLNSDLIPDDDKHQESITATLSLTAKDGNKLAASRAAKPTESPKANEGKLYDALIAIYGKSLTSTDLTGSVMQVVKVNLSETSSGSTVYRSEKFTLELPVGTYYFTVIANPASSVTASTFENMSLSNFVDYVYTADLCTVGSTIKTCDRFVMTSDDEGSFTVTTDNVDGGEELNITPTPMVVERLASRIDLSFGTPGTTLSNGSLYRNASNQVVSFSGAAPSAQVASIVLPVYDYNSYANNQLVLTGDTYTITGVDLLNVVSDKEYLIQRTSNGAFTDEIWNSATGYAKKTVLNPASLTRTAETPYTLAALIADGNNLYTKDGSRFYTLGYFRENTQNTSNSDPAAGKTTLRIKGTYHRTGDLESATGNYTYNIEHVIRHCMPEDEFIATNTMAYAMNRNTIYRIRIDKVFSDAERVYVRWYYDSTNDGEYDLEDTVTPFFSLIQEGDGTTPTD